MRNVLLLSALLSIAACTTSTAPAECETDSECELGFDAVKRATDSLGHRLGYIVIDQYGRVINYRAWRVRGYVPLLPSMTNPNAKPLQPVPLPPSGCRFIAPLTVQLKIWCS